jgi:WD40 repeat protein
MTWTEAATGIVDLKLSNNGKKLAVSSMGSAIKIWDLLTGKMRVM